MGLEALQISTCYKMAGRLKVVSYKMALDFGGIWALRPAFHRGNFSGVQHGYMYDL